MVPKRMDDRGPTRNNPNPTNLRHIGHQSYHFNIGGSQWMSRQTETNEGQEAKDKRQGSSAVQGNVEEWSIISAAIIAMIDLHNWGQGTNSILIIKSRLRYDMRYSFLLVNSRLRIISEPRCYNINMEYRQSSAVTLESRTERTTFCISEKRGKRNICLKNAIKILDLGVWLYYRHKNAYQKCLLTPRLVVLCSVYLTSPYGQQAAEPGTKMIKPGNLQLGVFCE
ncbi:hypothetical protein BDM02DRAFT_3126688 [Thelephora ganbajun]|uniref:Uncharacterized protein n=1 Tax=Thelephora ganbajun TaxID=370292 RepID=A0ACB6ZRC9_THEGA|nr:hypothetical protein BDM02DRAFT_3126688 [Thelephora ganbajun]